MDSPERETQVRKIENATFNSTSTYVLAYGALAVTTFTVRSAECEIQKF